MAGEVRRESAHVSGATKGEAVSDAKWELFPENADERRTFDDMTITLGGPLLVIANAAQVQARTMSIPGASFYETGLIHYNELVKAHQAIENYRKSVGAMREEIAALKSKDTP